MRNHSTAAYLLLASATVVVGRLLNVTIDDTGGDKVTGRIPIYYTSEHLWNARSASDGCASCGARPDGSQMLNDTWHDETTFPSQIPSNVSFIFTGPSLWIYCALANAGVDLLYRDTRLAFYLDDDVDPIATFHHVPTDVVGYDYNQPVFTDTTLPPGEHTMLVSNIALPDSGSLVLFDYALYTTEIADENSITASTRTSTANGSSTSISGTSPPSSSSPGRDDVDSTSRTRLNVGAIAGGIAGGLFVAFSACCFTWWCLRRRKRTRQAQQTEQATMNAVDPYQSYMEQWSTGPASVSPSAASPGDQGAFRRKGATEVSSMALTATAGSSGILSAGVSPTTAGDDADLRQEMLRMREELERLRQSVDVPPRYDDERMDRR